MATRKVPKGLSEVIGRALVDEDYRNQLFENREAALKGIKLSKADRAALDDIDRKMLEAHATRLTGSEATAITIAVGVIVHF
jgi:hypothetical protein